MDSRAAHCDGCSARRSNTMRTARSRISCENFVDFLLAQSSQRLEPPQNPGRLTSSRRQGLKSIALHALSEIQCREVRRSARPARKATKFLSQTQLNESATHKHMAIETSNGATAWKCQFVASLNVRATCKQRRCQRLTKSIRLVLPHHAAANAAGPSLHSEVSDRQRLAATRNCTLKIVGRVGGATSAGQQPIFSTRLWARNWQVVEPTQTLCKCRLAEPR